MLTKQTSMATKILELISLVGDMSTDEIQTFFSGKSYVLKVMASLKSDGYIKRSKDPIKTTYRLSLKGKKKLKSYLPEIYDNLLSSRKSMNVIRDDKGYKERRNKLCDLLTLLHRADIKIFPDEKILLRNYSVITGADTTDKTDFIKTSHPEFYTSVEIKEIIPDFNIAKGSRSLGVIISYGTIYIIYSTYEGELLWRKETEIKFTGCARRNLSEKLFGKDGEVKLIVFSEKESTVTEIMKRYTKKSCGKIFPCPELPEMIFALKDSSLDTTLKIITKPHDILEGPKEQIKKLTVYDGQFPFLDGRAVNDRYLYYLQVLLFDMYKASAAIDTCEKKGIALRIYCFDYQKRFIESIAPEYIRNRIEYKLFVTNERRDANE